MDAHGEFLLAWIRSGVALASATRALRAHAPAHIVSLASMRAASFTARVAGIRTTEVLPHDRHERALVAMMDASFNARIPDLVIAMDSRRG